MRTSCARLVVTVSGRQAKRATAEVTYPVPAAKAAATFVLPEFIAK